ncbi:MAG: glycosyltransferase family 4 protein [Candidatus Krumholzibacteriota bacterium]|nr:glycosyltransferase family 4 protein [Candidatus Krumholzibacteriota bacterium]
MTGRKICFFNTAPRWGGGEKWNFDMASGLERLGYDVSAVVGSSGKFREKIRRSGIPFFTVDISNLSFLNIFKIRKVRDFLTGNSIDTLIISLPSDLKVAGPAARMAGTRSVIYRRGSAIPLRDSPSNRYLFKNCVTSVIANSEETKRTILQNNAEIFDPAKIELIYNGIDLDEWDKRDSHPLFDYRNEGVVIGTAGRLEIEKAHDRLIDLAVILEERGLDFRLLIAGSGRLRKKLERYAEKRGVSGRIVFTGFVEEMKSFMAGIDIFLLSSLWEGFGYVLIESMASGVPVVAFDLSSTREIIEDGKTGFLVPPGEVQEMAEKVIGLAKDKNLLRKMGENGRTAVEKRFTADSALKKLQFFIDL